VDGTPVIVWGSATASPTALSVASINFSGMRLSGVEPVLRAGVKPTDLFEDYAKGNLMLTSSAVARLFGTTKDAPAIDIDRLTRQAESGHIDAGAYEFNSGPVNAAAAAGWTHYE
jgi:hypothetical protein